MLLRNILLLLGGLFPVFLTAQGLRHDPKLVSITFHERTSDPKVYTFAKDSPQLLEKRPLRLSPHNRDFEGWPYKEFYDVYYSNDDGGHNPNGKYITIDVAFSNHYGGGGGNIAGVVFRYANGETVVASTLYAAFGHGKNYAQGSERKATDGNLSTWSTLGNNRGLNRNLSLTVGLPPVYVETSPTAPKDIALSTSVHKP